jgi:putative ABC transport system ATP-binding protein
MLQTQHLRYRYRNGPELAFPDLSVAAGGRLLVLGESGCGKSTLLHLLAGLLQPASGEVRLRDTVLHSLSAPARDRFRGRHIGLVYQHPPFVASLSVRDNLLLSPFARQRAKEKQATSSSGAHARRSSAMERLPAMAERLGIAALLHRLPQQLSVGERQRAAIARALLGGPGGPDLILADEPTSALDRRRCDAVRELLIEQAAESGAALVVVTHDERLVPHFEQRVELTPAATRAPASPGPSAANPEAQGQKPQNPEPA